MKLVELKKYAIDHRVDIKFGDPQTAHECLINNRGLVKIPGDDKDFRVEEALDAAEVFEIIGNGNTQNLTREAMARIIAEASERKKPGASAEEEE
ncbi:MAG: hypothetical protein L0226_08245 [Acidobacteria bacterium]|nr:hypothetical protein [Acidobacteriota bacterium]MCI0660855.1 hypothetical protein [Acidobacteriota bacterium]